MQIAGHEVRATVSMVMWIVVAGAGLYGLYLYDRHTEAKLAERQVTVCPSFLSIARSARDTLLVMRNDPLCNRYVLDNLK